jgi:hypothetical protein
MALAGWTDISEVSRIVVSGVFRDSGDLISLFEHDLFRKPVPTFPDHALALRSEYADYQKFRQSYHGDSEGAPLCDRHSRPT